MNKLIQIMQPFVVVFAPLSVLFPKPSVASVVKSITTLEEKLLLVSQEQSKKQDRLQVASSKLLKRASEAGDEAVHAERVRERLQGLTA